MNTKETLMHEVINESCQRIATIERYTQRIEDCETICGDLNAAAKSIGVDVEFVPLVTIHRESAEVAAYVPRSIGIMVVAEVLDAAKLTYRLEAPIHYTNFGNAMAFGVEGFQDQVVIANPIHKPVSAEEAYEEAVAQEQLEKLAA